MAIRSRARNKRTRKSAKDSLKKSPRALMERAIVEARRCRPEDGRPNPMVGVVVVTRGGEVVAGYRGERKRGEHGEFTVLERKLRKATLAGATVYTTLEPCTTRNHPKVPCADRLIERKIARVVIGMLDPDHRICGRGWRHLSAANIAVQAFPQDLAAQVEELNREFTRSKTTPADPQLPVLSPPEHQASLSADASEELAHRYAAKGDSGNAIKWALFALRQCEKHADKSSAGQVALFLAQQYRHQGRLIDALRYYATAEQYLRASEHSFQNQLLTWRIHAGRILVEHYLLDGNARRALAQYQLLGKEIRQTMSSFASLTSADQTVFKTYLLHLRRQEAEMHRMLGEYRLSLTEYQRIYQKYSLAETEAKAYSLLGEADSNRLLGRFREASRLYLAAEQYARSANDGRFLARVLRNQVELSRVCGRPHSDALAELEEVSARCDYLFGQLYLRLSEAAQSLDDGKLESAQIALLEAKSLTHSNGKPIGIEFAHTILGLADHLRLTGDHEKAALLYREALEMYRMRGVAWGYLRAAFGLEICGNEVIRMPRRVAHEDAALGQLRSAYRRSPHAFARTLLLNLP